jgi:glycosyltransferase involved in cell wall biosynthesis
MTIVFINYGSRSNNSANHIQGFARELAALGHKVIIVSYDDEEAAASDQSAEFVQLSYAQFCLRLKTTAPRTLDPQDTILHAWTPRENVRLLVARVTSLRPFPYVVHLEDNELYITATSLGINSTQLSQMSDYEFWQRVPRGQLTKPHEMDRFFRRSRGMTIITPTLAAFCPPETRPFLLEPGVDPELFRPVQIEKRETILKELCLSREESYVAYTGNTHAANRLEVEALYEAVAALRSKGMKIKLLRTGLDHTRPDPSVKRREGWLTEFGVVDKPTLLKVMQIADFFVQPGGPNEFNAYRLPSKIPECMAMGRPVIMPRTNIGLRVRGGQEAVLMTKGDSDEIIAGLQLLIENPSLAARIGARGRNFAIQNFSWARSARALSDFYTSVCRA